MKNLILLFTLIFAFGFSQTIEAQPVPEEVVTETQYEKPSKGKKCKTKKDASTCKKECKKGKATKTKHQAKHEEHRYYKATGNHGHGKAKAKNKSQKTTCKRSQYQKSKELDKSKKKNN